MQTSSIDPPIQRASDLGSEGKFCILGAGSSGLAAAKNFQQQGIPYDCLERADDVGGNWYFGLAGSSIYRSTRLISSKRLTEYTDFPMPDHYPEHPDHDMVWRYLRSYADHFQIWPNIQFSRQVQWLEPAAGGGWTVLLDDGERRQYRGVVIANGHNWDARWPVLPGQFDGEVLHSSEYKSPDVLKGRRVLVVGGGNSGYDIATESAQHAAATFHSLRRSYPLLPRFHGAQPIDQCGEWMLRRRMPLWLRRMSASKVSQQAWKAVMPSNSPRADHPLFESHPAINSRWPHEFARGAIAVRPGLQELGGKYVQFSDGRRVDVDLIIFATGFRISFPFVSVERLNWQDGRPNLFLNIFHPRCDNLFVAGLIQPDSGQFGLVDEQAKLIAVYLRGLEERGKRVLQFRRHKQSGLWRPNAGIHYVDSPRHLLEVEHYSYRRELQRWIGRLE